MHTIPDWKTVPVERSYEMRVKALVAFNTVENVGQNRDDALGAAFQAMLAAAPSPPANAQDDAKDEQAAFEEWLERTCPSGDVEAVQRQWESSSDYADFHAPAAGDAQDLPELNADLLDILGRPNFTCIRIAQLLRLGGVEIAKKAEAEQATVIHYLQGFYLKHGSQWAEKADEDIERRRLAALSASQQQEG